MTLEEYKKSKGKAKTTLADYKDAKANNINILDYQKNKQVSNVMNTATSILNRTDNTKINPYIQKALTVKPASEKDIAEIKAYRQKQQEKVEEQERWDNLSIGEKIVDPFKTMGANIKYGDLGIKESQAWSEYRSKQDEASLVKAQEATKAREQYEASNDRIGKGNALTKDFAQYLPQLGGQLGAGLGGAAAGAGAGALGGAGTALVAGQLGPQVVVPEEIATVPVAALTGATWGGRGGYVAGTAKYSYDLMAGNAYKTLLDMGVPNEVALELSGDEALISSLIEGAGSVVDLISLGFGKLATKGGTTAAKKVALNRLAAAGKAYGLNLISEPLEEGAQQIVSIETQKKAAEKSGIERNVTAEEDKQSILDSMKGGFNIAAISGLGNVAGNVATNKVANTINASMNTDNSVKKLPQMDSQTSQLLRSIDEHVAKGESIPLKGTENLVDSKNVVPELPTMASQQAMLLTNQTEDKTAQTGNMEQMAKNGENDTEKFGKQVDALRNNKFNRQNELVVLEKTPQILLDLGLDNYPITIKPRKLETVYNETAKSKKDHPPQTGTIRHGSLADPDHPGFRRVYLPVHALPADHGAGIG